MASLTLDGKNSAVELELQWVNVQKPPPATARIITALLASAHRALPPSACEAGQYIVQASRLLQEQAHEAPPCSGGRPLPLAPVQIGRLERWIDSNLGRTIHIEHLAAVVNLSSSHFSRAFRQTLGKTPIAYVHHRRIDRAQLLMMTTRLSLAQIAVDCGLSDQSHLTRVFRRVTGMTPANWRRERGC